MISVRELHLKADRSSATRGQEPEIFVALQVGRFQIRPNDKHRHLAIGRNHNRARDSFLHIGAMTSLLPRKDEASSLENPLQRSPIDWRQLRHERFTRSPRYGAPRPARSASATPRRRSVHSHTLPTLGRASSSQHRSLETAAPLRPPLLAHLPASIRCSRHPAAWRGRYIAHLPARSEPCNRFPRGQSAISLQGRQSSGGHCQ